MVILCSAKDFFIMEKIRSGEWVPSLDTGEVYSTKKKDFLKFQKNKNGYRISGGIHLSHIIWVGANGAIPYGMQIDHINGDKADNRLCNLQLISAKENNLLSNARLTFTQAEEIRRKYAEGGTSYQKLAREYNVGKYVISDVLTNKTYTKPVDTSHVTEELRKEILERYKNGRTIHAIRCGLKIQTATVRQVLEEELNKEAKEANKQENKS